MKRTRWIMSLLFRRLPCSLVLLFFQIHATASVLAPWVGPNSRLGEDPTALPAGEGKNQAEPHVIRSVMDPDLLLATFQEGRYADGGARCNGYAVSEDGGFTWRRALNPSLTTLSGGPYFRATDPVGAISLGGELYLNSLVSLDSEFGLARLVIQRSTNRGKTWTQPITIHTGLSQRTLRDFPDKNWMVVDDYAGSPTEGRIVVTWTSFRTIVDGLRDIQDFLITSAFSDDKGDTWSTPVFVTPPPSLVYSRLQYQGSQPVFLPGGGLAIVFHNFLTERLELSYSPDGGTHFPDDPVPVIDGYILYDVPNMRDGSFLPSAKAARQTGDVYVAYTALASTQSTVGQIYFTRSDRPDPGVSPQSSPDWRFRTPIVISGDVPVRAAALATLSVSPDGQWVSVYFYDNRNGGVNNTAGDFYGVDSSDGGATWSPAYRLTEQTFELSKAAYTERGYMLGDYFGFADPAGPDQAAVAVWVDSRLANADPWSARIGSASGTVFNSWLQANFPYAVHQAGEAALRYADPDRDGTPNLLEYIIGQSPSRAEIIPSLTDGLLLRKISVATDPDTQVVVRGRFGRWPVSGQVASPLPEILMDGEGFWEQWVWADGSQLEQIEFSINDGAEMWFLLSETAPVRWVRDFDAGWVWSPWFGFIYTESAPWLFHLSLGWVYDLGGALYSSKFETWLYPGSGIHPWVYQQDGSFLYLLKDAPWAYDSSSDSWIQTY